MKNYSKASSLGGVNASARVTVFGSPDSNRCRLSTTNLVDRLEKESGRRTRVERLFPNGVACLQLISDVLMEISEAWQAADKRYIVLNDEEDTTKG